MYLIGEKIEFEHVPKTGGKALLDAFAMCDELLPVALQAKGHHVGHARREFVSDRRFHLPGFRFGIVRDPVEWYRSLWKYLETPDCGVFEIDPAIGHPFRPIIRWLRRGVPCSDFVGELVHKADGFYSAMAADYLGKADLIGRTDNLGPAGLAACRAVGIELTESERWIIGNPRRVNVSRPIDTAGDATISDDVVRSVQSIESAGVAMFSRAGVYTETGSPVPVAIPRRRKRRRGR